MSIPASVLAFVFLVGCSLTVFKLIRTKLARSYRAFFIFIAFEAVQTGAGLVMGEL